MAGEQVVVSERQAVGGTGIALSDIASPALRDLYLYWLDKWQGLRMPMRADIEPLEMPALLPLVYLIDVEREPLRFRFRLIGTRIVAWFGRDITGHYVAERYVDRYREVVESGCAAYDALHEPGKAGRHGLYQRLVMPLAGADGNIEMLLGGVQPTPTPI